MSTVCYAPLQTPSGKKKNILFLLSKSYDSQRLGNTLGGPLKQYIKKYTLTI